MELNSVDVAAYIVKEAATKNYYIDLTKLQKILFACYGTYLAVTGDRLCDEQPKAWPHGPVFPRVYSFTKKHIDFIQAFLERKENVREIIGSGRIYILEDTIKFFSQFKAGELVNWTHKVNSPWDLATNHGQNLQGAISDDLIKDYFKKIINTNENTEKQSN